MLTPPDGRQKLTRGAGWQGEARPFSPHLLRASATVFLLPFDDHNEMQGASLRGHPDSPCSLLSVITQRPLLTFRSAN